MPSYLIGYSNDGARIRAWEAHYVAKGCTTKAGADAYRKLRSSTWPPSLQARVQ